METTDLGFEYGLAEQLKMTLGQLRRMPASEFEGWKVFYAVREQQRELERAKTGG